MAFNEETEESQKTGLAESADTDFLLTFVIVTGIASLYISLQLSQMWSLAFWLAASLSYKSYPGVICSYITNTVIYDDSL